MSLSLGTNDNSKIGTVTGESSNPNEKLNFTTVSPANPLASGSAGAGIRASSTSSFSVPRNAGAVTYNFNYDVSRTPTASTQSGTTQTFSFDPTRASAKTGGFEDPMSWTDDELISREDFDAVQANGRLGVGAGPEAPRGVTKEALDNATAQTQTQFETPVGAGGGSVSISITEVAAAAGLNSQDLVHMSTYLTGPANKNLLAAWVYLLLNGASAAGKTVQAKGNNNVKDQPITISGNMLMYLWTRGNSIVKGNFNTAIEQAFKKTPAYKSKFFEDVGEIGHSLVSSTDNLPNNPMTGSAKQTPSLLEQALNKIHPRFTEELEKYINVLKGKAYLALPAGILGSIQYAINYITGVVTYIAQMINEVYQGALKMIKEFIAAIDSIMGIVMQWLLTLLDRIIPLEIICFILDIISIFVGDLTFITNLFSSSAKISDVLNTFGIAPEVANFLSNPIDLLTSFLPEEVQNIMNIVNSVANDPLGYLGSVLADYGYSYMAYYLQGDIMGGILNQFGSQAPVLYPLAAVFRKYGITGQVQLFDPNAPSRNVVLPPWLTEARADVQRTFDSLGRNLDKSIGAFNEGVYDVAKAISPNPEGFGIPSNNFGIDSGSTGT
jgi:hypothetical protein